MNIAARRDVYGLYPYMRYMGTFAGSADLPGRAWRQRHSRR